MPTVAEVRTPAAPGTRGEGPGSSFPAACPTRRLARLWEGAEGAPAEPKSALRSGACTRRRSPFPARDPSRRRRPWPWPWLWRWARASCPQPLRRQPRASPGGGGAPVAEPAPALRGALAPRLTGGAPQAGWRERPRHGRPAPPRPARGRERPAPPARAPAFGGRGRLGEGARLGAAATTAARKASPARRGAATPYPPSLSLPPFPSRVSCSVPGFREGEGVRAAPQPEVCPGSRAARSLCERLAGLAACGPRGRGQAARSPAQDRAIAEQGPLRPRVAGPALPGRRGEGERADRGGSEGPRTQRSWQAPGTERAPASAATLQRASLPGWPLGTDAPVPGGPRSRQAVPRGPERAAGNAPKAVITPKRGFGLKRRFLYEVQSVREPERRRRRRRG